MNTIQVMIYRNVQAVAEGAMAKMWRLKDALTEEGSPLYPQALQVRAEIEADWDVIGKIIIENQTPQLILTAVKQYEFSDAGLAYVKAPLQEQCKYAMEKPIC